MRIHGVEMGSMGDGVLMVVVTRAVQRHAGARLIHRERGREGRGIVLPRQCTYLTDLLRNSP